MLSSKLTFTYACLSLHEDGIAITADKIATLVKDAGEQVEGYWPGFFAKLCKKRSVDDLITNAGGGGGGAVAVSVAPVVTAIEVTLKEEEKKADQGYSLREDSVIELGLDCSYVLGWLPQEEPKEESDNDMRFSLFD